MLKKIFLTLMITAVSLFAMNFQTASKEELMTIKGIGEKRATSIIKYRKTHKLKSATDLTNIPGIGSEIADNAKKGIKNTDKKVTKAKKSAKSVKKSTDKVKSAKETKTKTKKKVKKATAKKTKKAAKDKTKKAKKSLKKVKEKVRN